MTKDSPSGNGTDDGLVNARASAAEYLEAVKTGQAAVVTGEKAEAARKDFVKLATMILDGAAPKDIARYVIDNERKRRWRESGELLLTCYLEVLKKYGGDFRLAAQVFDNFTTEVAKRMVPKKPRGESKHKVALNERLLTARKKAEQGRIENNVADAAGARTLAEQQTPLRQGRRIAEREKKAARDDGKDLKMLVELWRHGSADAEFAPGIIAWRRQQKKREGKPDK